MGFKRKTLVPPNIHRIILSEEHITSLLAYSVKQMIYNEIYSERQASSGKASSVSLKLRTN